ncbi:MAG: DUF4198 domain-containing protein [Thermodesulfobacteriota bacterium]
MGAKKRIRMTAMALGLFVLLAAVPAAAHFGALIPSDAIVTQDEATTLNLDIKFLHPLERHLMEMAKPKQFGVMLKGKKTDLLDSLQARQGKSPDQAESSTYWQAKYKIRRPGDHTFYLEPKPYWEPAEDLFIVHYTKVCVNAFGLEEGWDKPVGMETEIVPLTRPYGLWTNNLFTGQVFFKGKPVPHAEVEIEYLNDSPGNNSLIQAPAAPFVTQVVKADENGIFSYAMPKAGWWGFSALSEAEWTLKHEGRDKGVEIGAVYWVHTQDMQ